MNATTFAELRHAAAGSQSDQKMDQVRELLFGEFEREVRARLNAMEARIEALATTTDRDRRRQFEELSRAISELGTHVGTISRR